MGWLDSLADLVSPVITGTTSLVSDIFGGDDDSSGSETSAEELSELEQYQLDILKEEQATWEALEPYYLEQYGLVKNTDPETGEITYTKTEEQAALDEINTQIETTSAERELAALEGTLPVDQSVEDDIQKGRDQLTATLTSKLGTGAEGSEAWNRAIAAYDSEAEALRYSIRTGEITNYEAINTIASNNESSTASGLSNIVNPYSSISSSLDSLISGERAEETAAATLASQEEQASMEAVGSAIGIGAGILA